jgi:hypothetical protein
MGIRILDAFRNQADPGNPVPAEKKTKPLIEQEAADSPPRPRAAATPDYNYMPDRLSYLFNNNKEWQGPTLGDLVGETLGTGLKAGYSAFKNG